MPRERLLARLGAAAYVVWSFLHFQAAWSTYELGRQMAPGLQAGRVLQDAWNLMWFAILSLIGAALFNWRNDLRGWWINLVTVSVADLGFIVYVLLPGYAPAWPGLAGPVFWILGLALTSAANPWAAGRGLR